MLIRRTLAVLLIAAALLLAAAATSGRRAVAAAEAQAVSLGEYGQGLPELGDADSFEPFAFAVVGPVRGSHAALGRALAELEAHEDLRAIVLLGDVLDETDDPLPLAVTLAAREPGQKVIAVAGATDLERLQTFQRHVSPPDWSFRDRDCLFTTWGPGSQGDAERVPASDVVARFLFTTAPASAPDLAWTETFAAAPAGGEAPGGDDVRVEIVRVGEGAQVARDAFTVSRGPSARSLFTDLSVGVLHPVSRSALGLIGLLAAAATAVFVALRLARAPSKPA